MRRRKSKRGLMIGGIAAGILIAAVIVTGIFWFRRGGEGEKEKTPEELLMEYTDYIRTGNYEAMYGMLNEQSRKNIGLEDFTARNKNIYEGIGAADIRVEDVYKRQRYHWIYRDMRRKLCWSTAFLHRTIRKP